MIYILNRTSERGGAFSHDIPRAKYTSQRKGRERKGKEREKKGKRKGMEGKGGKRKVHDRTIDFGNPA